ncbi:putative ribonuclease H-like domain-containing protein [Tanacetum coccineum]
MPLGSKEVIDIDVQTEEAADLMVVSFTSLTGATRKAAVSEKIDQTCNSTYQNEWRCPVQTNTLRIHIAPYLKVKTIGDPNTPVQTRSSHKKITEAHALISEALKMKAGLKLSGRTSLQFKLQQVFNGSLVDLPKGAKVIGTKRLEAIREFMSPQPPGFVDPDHPKKVYKVVKALYGLHQAPRAWFQMSARESLHFSRLQVKQSQEGIFISQDKYVAEILKKFDFVSVKSAVTPMETKAPLAQDEGGPDVDLHLYRSMIGCLMYLTASRPDIMYAVCACSRFQEVNKLGAAILEGGIISWQCKKQTIVATSTTEAEYVAAASCCGQYYLELERMLQAQLGHEKGHASCHLLIGCRLVEQLQLADASGINMLQNEEIFAGLQNIGSKSGGWDQFGSNIATALICQPQPSAAPTPSQPVPTPTPSHVQIPTPPITSTPPSTQPPPTLTQPVQSTTPPPQPSSVQLTSSPPPIQPVQPTHPPSPQIPSPPHNETEGPSFEPSYHMMDSRVASLEKDSGDTNQTLGTAVQKLIKKVIESKKISKEKKKKRETEDEEDAEAELNTVRQKDSKEEGKAPMTEEDLQAEVQASKKSKELQELADLEAAQRLQATMDAEAQRQIHLDALLARRLVEQEEEAAKEALATEFDYIQARLNADQILAEKIQQEEREQYSIEDRAKFLHDTIAAQRKFLTEQRYAAIRNKPPTISQLRNQMITLI